VEALPIQLSLVWPAVLEGGKRLMLKIRGETLWVNGKYVAVRILHHDFHVLPALCGKPDLSW
jgi:hypothetical protein